MTEKQHWNTQATETLLLMWGRDAIEKKQRQLKWDNIFEKISDVLNSMGYNFSGRQCHTKMKNMIQTYRRDKKRATSEGREVDTMFRRELDYIFDPLAATAPPLFSRMHVEIGNVLDPVEPLMSEEQVIASSPVSPSNSDRSSGLIQAPPIIGGTEARQLPVLFALAPNCSGGGSGVNNRVSYMMPTVPSNTATRDGRERMSPVIVPTPVVTIDTTSTQELQQQPHIELAPELELDSSTSSSEDEPVEAPITMRGRKKRKKTKNSHVDALMVLLQEQAEDREDARQRRLLEHEKRMEARRQRWEERMRERELLVTQKWEEQRKEWEYRQLQQVTQMFLQGLQQMVEIHATGGHGRKDSLGGGQDSVLVQDPSPGEQEEHLLHKNVSGEPQES